MIKYGSPTVTLIVGPENVVMTAHKAVLTKDDGFFATCLKDGRFAEGINYKITLPDEEPENIGKILAFLYTGTLSWNHLQTSGPSSSTTELIEFYILADKYCLKDMAYAAVNAVDTGNWRPREPLFWSQFQLLKDSGLQGGMMWSKLVDSLCDEVLHDGCDGEYSDDLGSLLNGGLESDPAVAIDFLREISNSKRARARARARAAIAARANGWG